MRKTWVAIILLFLVLFCREQTTYSSWWEKNTPTDTPTSIPTKVPTKMPTSTPTPTLTPTHTATPTPTPTPYSDIGKQAIQYNAGGGVVSYTFSELLAASPVTPTPTSLPTPTQIPVDLVALLLKSLQPTATPTVTPTPSSTPTPTTTVIQITNAVVITAVPTPTPTPTPTTVIQSTIVPVSLATATTKTETTQVYEVKNDAVSEIKVAPITTTSTATVVLLPQEQKLVNEAVQNSGVLLTLQGKTGEQYTAEQEEFVIKRTNQLVSITTQDNASTTGKTTNSSPQLQINSNNIIAHSSMSISIDPLSGILTVDTPNGPQKVSIMPDEALSIATELHALDQNQAPTPSIALVVDNGALTYHIEGGKTEKLIGLFPISLDKTVSLSADTGGITKISSSALTSLIGLLTF